jgi:hypothetical protein
MCTFLRLIQYSEIIFVLTRTKIIVELYHKIIDVVYYQAIYFVIS